MDGSVLLEKAMTASVWILCRIADFPRDQRYIVGRRMSDIVLEFDEKLVHAWRARRKDRLLDDLSVLLDEIRFYLRLSLEMHFISDKQFEHGAELCRELGKLLGGWTRSEKAGRMDTGGGD